MSTVLSPKPLFPLTRQALGWLNEQAHAIALVLGQAVETAGEAGRFLLKGRLSLRETIAQISFIGVDALGISLILTLFAGMVIALQVAQELTKQGAGQLVGGLVAISVLRELAPIMTGFAVIAMVGSAYAAEISTMKIQKQVDALDVFKVNPIRYLVLPRLVAGLVSLPMMTALTSLAGLVGGMMVAYFIADLNTNLFLESVWQYTEPKDLVGALLKAAVFGGLIVIFSTTIGLQTTGGSKEVGISTTRAVVWSVVAMAVADFVLSYIMFGGVS